MTAPPQQSRPTSRHRRAADRLVNHLPPQMRWAVGALLLTLREPADGFDRLLVRVRERALPGRCRSCAYRVEDDWQATLHAHLGQPWPCAQTVAFERLWAQILAELYGRSVFVGRGTYGGWDDADRSLAAAIWCLVCHLRPQRVVETGVAHGITSRVVLEALERAGAGHLWSIDLPAMDPTLHGAIAVAVPERLRGGWTYIAGTSRRHLPGLLAQLRRIDMFIHDSSHTRRNMLFELRQAWPALDRGAIVADDVNQSAAFADFVAAVAPDATYVAPAADAAALFGIALKGL